MIEILYFSGNALSGTIPRKFANASALRDLYLDGNILTGTIPSILPGQLPALTEFRLEMNSLVGSMPESICALTGNKENENLVTLVTDCGGTPQEVMCSCCSSCVPESAR